ncbi:MAG: outer membrane beta-barrel protein, partial [Pseudomonadota bacterium]|nr:outer membrane beta-barrel protein [Pseudomonadota bacterium]
YFGVWGGAGEFDSPSKGAMDQAILDNLASEIAFIPIQPDTNLSVTEVFGSTQDDSLTPWGLQVGFRFNKWVAAEIGYVDLGEYLYSLSGAISGDLGVLCSPPTCDPADIVPIPLDGGFERSTQLTSSGITASVLSMFPLGSHFDLHIRGGIYYADTRVTNRLRYIDGVDQDGVFNLLHRRVDASQTELFGGLGAAWNINENFALRVEYQKYFDVGDDDKAGESDVDVINVSVLFK